LINWQWGEAYFAEKLLDYEMSSNVGNWQWAAEPVVMPHLISESLIHRFN
jgi:deoxyribodipyrimidine photolyase